MFIGDSDHRRALQLIGEVSQSATLKQFINTLLPGAGRLIGVDEIGYVEMRPRTYEVRYLTAYPTPPASVPIAARTLLSRPAEHPWVARWDRLGRVGAVRLSDLYTSAELSRLPYYADFYRPRELYYGDHIVLRRDAARVVVLTFGRRSRDFADPEHDLIELIRRPLGAVAETVEHANANRQFLPAMADRGSVGDALPAFMAQSVALTTGERRVVGLLCLGHRNYEIAATLGVTTKAVEQHLTHLYRKAGVRSRVELLTRLDELPHGHLGHDGLSLSSTNS